MAVNKVVYAGDTLIDLTNDSVTPETLALGVTAHDASGQQIIGTMTGGGGSTEPDPRDLYQRVEYIESAEEGTYPYVVTDFIADNDSGLEVVASFPTMQDRIPMGSREDSGSTRFYCVYPLSTSSVYYGFNTGSSISCTTKVNTVYRLQTNFLNSRLINVYEENGTRKVNSSINATLATQSAPVAIFGYNSASSGAVSSKREFKLYSARCSRKHEVVREYIPCCRKSDGVIGLYEKFTGVFLTTETGSFAKGADVEWEYSSDSGAASDPVIEPLTITENGTYTAPEGVDGYSPVTVNVKASGGDTAAEDGIITRTIGAEYSNDRVTSVGDYAFYKCTSLQRASFQNVKTIGTYGFWNSGVTSVSFPSLTTISGAQCFYACRSLASVEMPVLESIAGSHCFYNAKALIKADFPKLINIAGQAFATSALATLILRSSTACTLANTNVLTSTPIASGTGYIYVPSALIDTYKAATNWSTYENQFRVLEDYTVDGTVTGELDESKI